MMANTLDPISGNQFPKQMETAAIANDRAIPGRFFFTSQPSSYSFHYSRFLASVAEKICNHLEKQPDKIDCFQAVLVEKFF